MRYGAIPHFKVEVGSTTYTDDECFSIQVVRPENNISYCVLQVNDYKSKNFIGVFDALDTLDVSFKYDNDDYTKVFSGTVITAKPTIDLEKGEILEVGAWGLGYALLKTHCNTSYGVESENTTKDTLQEIIQDLIDNYINKSFGGAATGYSIGKTKVENVHSSLSVTHLNGAYQDNFTLISKLGDIDTAYAQALGSPEVGSQWFVDTSGNLYFKKIDTDSSDAAWTEYYGGSQSAATVTVSTDMMLYEFRKNIEEYANKVVLCSEWRKPAYDYPTENQKALWGTSNITLSDEATTKIVGTHSLKAEPTTSSGAVYFYYPSAQNAAWDFSKIGSKDTVPTLNFQIQTNVDMSARSFYLGLHTDGSNYYYIDLGNLIGSITDKFHHIKIPIGPYAEVAAENAYYNWIEQGTGDWTDINYIYFYWLSNSTATDIFLDDLHFSGKIVREAYDSTVIAANNEYQKVIRNDTALDDAGNTTTNTGTAARLVYAELLRRKQTPYVGIVQFPGIIDLLPGQKLYVNACQQSSGSYRIQKDMRCKEVKQIFHDKGLHTVVNLTDDVTNSHCLAAPTIASILQEYVGALSHSEAKNLKSSGIDILVPKLSVDYPS